MMHQQNLLKAETTSAAIVGVAGGEYKVAEPSASEVAYFADTEGISKCHIAHISIAQCSAASFFFLSTCTDCLFLSLSLCVCPPSPPHSSRLWFRLRGCGCQPSKTPTKLHHVLPLHASLLVLLLQTEFNWFNQRSTRCHHPRRHSFCARSTKTRVPSWLPNSWENHENNTVRQTHGLWHWRTGWCQWPTLLHGQQHLDQSKHWYR